MKGAGIRVTTRVNCFGSVFRLGNQLGVRHLDCNQPIQLLIVGQIDEAETAFAQDLLDAVATDTCGVILGIIIRLERLPFCVLRHIVGI